MDNSKELEKAYKLIGKIKCTGMEPNGDGSYQVFFDYDEKFKQEYKRLFKLTRFSKKHFEKTLAEAIENFRNHIEQEKKTKEE